MTSLAIICAWCRKPLLDEAHAKKHVLTSCPIAPATELYKACKSLLPYVTDGQVFTGREEAVAAARAAIARAEGEEGPRA